MGTADLSVILPVYNEGGHLLGVVSRIRRHLDTIGPDAHIVLVNDGSDDYTDSTATRLAGDADAIETVSYPENQGKGHAIRTGVKHAPESDYYLFVDADRDLHPATLQDFFRIQSATSADIVAGSKWHPVSQINYPTYRRLLSKSFSLFTGALLDIPVDDTQTGMKLLTGEAADTVLPLSQIDGYAFDTEILALAQEFGYRIEPAPVSLDFGHDSNLRPRTALQIGIDTLHVYRRVKRRRHEKTHLDR